jgi:hypothetical protein
VGDNITSVVATSQNLEINKGCVKLSALPFIFKSILRQKKNYENSNISP